jgi:hypothetical protein
MNYEQIKSSRKRSIPSILPAFTVLAKNRQKAFPPLITTTKGQPCLQIELKKCNFVV